MEISLSEHFSYKKLIRFTLPTIAMMIFTSIYGVVDGFFVSNIIGSDAFAEVNFVLPVTMIAGTVGFMFGTGGSAIVSKTLGEGKSKKANEYFSLFIYLETIIGILITVVLWIVLQPVISWMGATEEMLDGCMIYGRILLIGMPAFILQNSFQSFMVAAERPRFGLVISIVSGVTNMVLDFVFMYIFNMGLAGAAIATIIGQAVGAGIPLVFFIFNKKAGLHLGRAGFELKPVLKAVTNGSSEMVTNLSMSLVGILYNIQLMKFAGADGVSAYGIIMYVGFIFNGTYLGYSVGCAPVISYHYGAQNTSEIRGLLRKSLILLGAAAVILTGAAELLAGVLAGIFVGYDKELLEFTAHAIRCFALSYIISWFTIFSSAFFTALNNGLISALISFMRTLVFEVAMILLLPAVWGTEGIWFAVVFAELMSFAVSAAMLIINRKKYKYF